MKIFEVKVLPKSRQIVILFTLSKLIFSLCEHFGTEIVIINRTEDSSFEEDLAQDVLEKITVFSARLYGSRSHKNKNVVEELREVASRL